MNRQPRTKLGKLLQVPVDTDATAQAPPEQNTQQQHGPSWSIAKRRWLNGDSVADIAEELGIPRATIYDHSKRYDWPPRGSTNPNGKALAALHPEQQRQLQESIQQHVAAVQPLVSEAVKREMQQWFDGVLQSAKSIKQKLDEKLERRLEVEELKSLALTLSSVDSTARRTFGLDQPGGPTASPWAAASLARQCPVIDVEPIPAKDSAPYNSHYIQSATTEAAEGQDQAHISTGPAQ